MKIIIIILLLPFYASLQNFVQNGDFEEKDSCFTELFSGQTLDYVPYWNGINGGGYCNRCSGGVWGVPNNNFTLSFQESHSGDGYAGFDHLNVYSINYRSFLQNQLSQPLQAGTCYYVELYTSLLNNVMYATNNLGLYFTNSASIPLKVGYEYLLEGSPQIYKFGNPIISDTMNWVKVAGIYEAQGGEQYLTIGNFSTDEETDTLIFDPNAYDAAFYYIDDVSVIPINPSSMPANAGVDKLVAPGDSVFIGQEVYNLNCTWRTLNGTVIGINTSGVYVKPTQTTTYVVEQNLCGVISYDTVVVTVGYVSVSSPSADGEGLRRVTISPNPNNGSFTIQSTSIAIQELTLLDELGRTIQILDPKSKTFNLNLPKGLYFLELVSEKDRYLEKIVVN